MSVESILKRKGTDVTTITPGATIKRAADWLRVKNIGCLVVTDGQQVFGLISEREIVHAFSHYGKAAAAMPVKEIMRHGVITVFPDESINRVMNLMTRHRVRHMPVCATVNSPVSSASATWSDTAWTIWNSRPTSCAMPTLLRVEGYAPLNPRPNPTVDSRASSR